MAVTWRTQRNWRWCNKCQGLWFGPNQATSNCPEGGTHSLTGSGNYSLVVNAAATPVNHQAAWRWCNKCQGLWFGPNQATSNCPEGGTHSLTGSGNYALANNVGAGQTGWRWCSKCQGLWFGPNQTTSNCPEGGTHSLTGSGNYRIPIVTSGVRVHAKVLVYPDISIATLFQNMREVYATRNVDVQWVTEEVLNQPALNIVDVGSCSGSTTAEQNQLYNNRNFVGTNEIVCYFVQATNPPYNGCASHPPGKPGSVVVKTATQWTFAHENGHVLDLNHVNDNNRLMTGNGTANITNPPPDLVSTEGSTMQASVLTIPA
ncbi:MAG: hypothetical protein M3323_06585 [Actinomycetota bacterium]|nr:hypothetical protein [Actinomycetota bacterium]